MHDHHGHEMTDLNMWGLPWNWNIGILLTLVLLVVGYCYAMGPLRQHKFPQEPLDLKRVSAFGLGIVLLFFGIVSPLNAQAMEFFTAHMLQHLVLALLASPLLIIGLPHWLIHYLLRPKWLHKSWKWLVNPFIASILFTGNLWMWHAPPILDAMIRNHYLHLLMLFLFVFTGVLFWWALFAPETEEIPSVNLVGKFVLILLTDMPMVVMGAGFTFMPPFYQVYMESALRWGIDATFDQRLGGLLMWVPGSIFLIVIASILFWQWINEMEKRDRLELIAELEAEQQEQQASAG